MSLPELSHLDRLRKLRGDAMVTHPGGSLDVIKVERVFSVPRGTPEPAYLSPDAQYPGAVLVEQNIIGGDHQAVEVYRMWHTLPGVAATQHTIDEETRAPVTVTTQLIATPEPEDLEADPGTQIDFTPINSKYGNKITTVINGGNAAGLARTEYRLVEYTFPALLNAIGGVALTGRDGTSRVVLNSDLRGAFTRLVKARVEITYGPIGTLHENMPDLFQPRLNNLIYNGVSFDINERNVLNDRIPPEPGFIQYVSGPNNPKWPFFIEQYHAEPSSPLSRSAYLDLVEDETEVPISASIRPWRAGWERMEVIHITLQ